MDDVNCDDSPEAETGAVVVLCKAGHVAEWDDADEMHYCAICEAWVVTLV